ncbi:unnamed protein product [Triticum turgidum subsp. durum]|uniref:Uncharacterized protein n=1 Tax=Triticum turgidum subsp. durum TaxID=4567 RepID=A0A9R0Y5E4_TRITD|nr:unnamed protein product [Triticum turgidum subsp. durum]
MPYDNIFCFSLFFKQEMELSLVGLQNAGKTSLVNSIATGGYSEDMIPTVGFNMRKVTKGNVTIKLWDLGGQRRFRTIYVVDAADRDSVPIAKSELHDLLTKQSLSGIPLLILGNKIDKSEALSKPALVDQLLHIFVLMMWKGKPFLVGKRDPSTILIARLVKIILSPERNLSSVGPWVEEIKTSLREFMDFKVAWARRSATSVAHKLARVGVGEECCQVWVGVPPEFILDVVSDDIPLYV